MPKDKDLQTVKLSELITFVTGKKNSNAAIVNGEYPFFTCSPTTLAIDTFSFDQRAILLAGNNASGIFSIKKYQGKFDAYQRTYIIDVIDSNKTNFNYMFYAIQLQLKHLQQISVGSATRFITKPIIDNLSIFLPPLLEQESIALTLSCLDDKIELNAQMNKTLEEMAQAIFKSWFVDFDPFKDGEFEDSELGKIPKGWKVGKLSDIADIVMGQSPEGTSYNEEGNGEIFYQGRGEFNWRFPTQRLFTTEPKRMAEIGDILMSVRAPVGDINVSMDRCCIGRGLSKIRSKNNHQSFVLYLMKNLKQQFTIYNGEGTVFGSINKDTLNDLKIVLPIISSVNKFEHIVSAYDEKILRNTIETEQLKNLRDYLLPKLMSGEIRVPLEKK